VLFKSNFLIHLLFAGLHLLPFVLSIRNNHAYLIAFTLNIATFCFIIPIFLFSFLRNSTENSADIQYRDEEQDEGSHDDGRCYILEVDFPEHFGLSYRDISFPLEYGG
jgi:hypothetical protein